jgi:cytidyltransferase-like protein
MMDPIDKSILVSIYSAQFESIPNPYEYVKNRSIIPKEVFESRIKKLRDLGFIERSEIALTFLGRESIKVVLVGGVFDILHPGHLHTLKAAKSYGDVLVVVVARSSTALKINKSRIIYHDEMQRKELVSSIRCVDIAMVGFEGTLYKTVEYVKPDIIALGYDQAHGEKEIALNCRKRGLNIQVVRLNTPIPRIKSSSLKQELGSSIYDI